MNDILMEDNKVFNEETYKFKPPARDPEQFKANDPNQQNQTAAPQKAQPKRERPDNKENMPSQANFDPNQAAPRRQPYNQKGPNQNRGQNPQKKEQAFFLHPDVHFCEKKNREELPDDVEIRNTTLHCFGVDFFSQDEIMEFFANFNPQKVEWINDSSCNVHFEDSETSANAIFSLTTQIEDNAHELDWRKGLDYEKDGRVFNLMIRYGTVLDSKAEETKGANSKYYRFARQQFMKKRPHPNDIRKKISKDGGRGGYGGGRGGRGGGYQDRGGYNNYRERDSQGYGQQEERKPNTMTIMDRKRTMKRKVVRNNVEVMNQFPNGGRGGYGNRGGDRESGHYDNYEEGGYDTQEQGGYGQEEGQYYDEQGYEGAQGQGQGQQNYEKNYESQEHQGYEARGDQGYENEKNYESQENQGYENQNYEQYEQEQGQDQAQPQEETAAPVEKEEC
jgi:hypothetical protein